MKNYLIYFIIAFGVTACGSRKTNTDIAKQSSERTELSQEKGTGKEEVKSGSEKTAETKTDVKQTETTTTINTKFDSAGNKVEETKTTTTKDLTDRSVKIERRTIYYTRNLGWTNERTLTIREKLTFKLKSKQTERVDVYVYLFWGLLGIVIWYVAMKKAKLIG